MKIPPSPGAYMLTHVPTGTFYIGSTGNLQRRISQHKAHLLAGTHKNPTLRELVRSWGEIEIKYELATCSDQALDREQELLDLFFRDRLCCNVADDARNPWENGVPPVVLDKIVKFHTGRDRGEGFRQMRKEMMTGISRTDEEKAKISAALTGRRRPPEVVEAIRRGRQGWQPSDETRSRMSEAKRGKPGNPASLAAMSAAVSKAVWIEGVRYSSTAEAARKLDIRETTIRQRLKSTTGRFEDWYFE